jgi:hypothetical protein
MRSERIRTGLHRVGIVLAAIATLPAFWGLWYWTQGVLDPEAWKPIGASLLVAAGIYAAFWSVAWIIGGFTGDSDKPPT